MNEVAGARIDADKSDKRVEILEKERMLARRIIERARSQLGAKSERQDYGWREGEGAFGEKGAPECQVGGTQASPSRSLVVPKVGRPPIWPRTVRRG